MAISSLYPLKKTKTYDCLRMFWGLDSCDPLELEMDAKLQFVDGMTTKEIQKTLVQTAIEKVISKKTTVSATKLIKWTKIGSL